jgi:hypothetical protein
MLARKIRGIATALFGSAFAMTSASGQTNDAASFNRQLRTQAEKGQVESQYKLGIAYDEGLGVARDYTEAFKWYRLAAEQGHVHSQYPVGDMYMSGNGVAKNDAEAVKWFARRQNRVSLMHRGLLGSCTPKVRACRKIT